MCYTVNRKTSHIELWRRRVITYKFPFNSIWQSRRARRHTTSWLFGWHSLCERPYSETDSPCHTCTRLHTHSPTQNNKGESLQYCIDLIKERERERKLNTLQAKRHYKHGKIRERQNSINRYWNGTHYTQSQSRAFASGKHCQHLQIYVDLDVHATHYIHPDG